MFPDSEHNGGDLTGPSHAPHSALGIAWKSQGLLIPGVVVGPAVSGALAHIQAAVRHSAAHRNGLSAAPTASAK